MTAEDKRAAAAILKYYERRVRYLEWYVATLEAENKRLEQRNSMTDRVIKNLELLLEATRASHVITIKEEKDEDASS